MNELAPRPHNSGHLTFDFAITSQFEQQVRTMRFAASIDGNTTSGGNGKSVATLGGRRAELGGGVPVPDVKLLYGKTNPRPGRKMGHLATSAATVGEAQDRVMMARMRC